MELDTIFQESQVATSEMEGHLRIKSPTIRSNDFTYAATKVWVGKEMKNIPQDQALAWLLLQRNADAVHRDKPLSDVTALLTEMLQTGIEDAVPQCQAARQTCISDAMQRASPDQWAKIADMLGVKVP